MDNTFYRPASFCSSLLFHLDFLAFSPRSLVALRAVDFLVFDCPNFFGCNWHLSPPDGFDGGYGGAAEGGFMNSQAQMETPGQGEKKASFLWANIVITHNISSPSSFYIYSYYIILPEYHLLGNVYCLFLFLFFYKLLFFHFLFLFSSCFSVIVLTLFYYVLIYDSLSGKAVTELGPCDCKEHHWLNRGHLADCRNGCKFTRTILVFALHITVFTEILFFCLSFF